MWKYPGSYFKALSFLFLPSVLSYHSLHISGKYYLHQLLTAVASYSGSTSSTSSASTSNLEPFWSEGLNFKCTGCGKCCQTDGEVWLNTHEFVQLVDSLHLPARDVLTLYVDEVTSGWVKLKNKPRSSQDPSIVAAGGDECIFLGDDHKSCTVYATRPVQCRTYPFWPRLLFHRSAWESEKVISDDSPLTEGRKWSASEGGCEGIDNLALTSSPSSSTTNTTTIHPPLISPQHIRLSEELYQSYHQSFPYYLGNALIDPQQLLDQVDLHQRVLRATRAWIQQFVINYNLCPFADKVYRNNQVRYIVLLQSDKASIIKHLIYELLYLWTHPPEDIETTILVLPFFQPEFHDYYQFSLEVEEDLLPHWHNVYLHGLEEDHLESGLDFSNTKKNKDKNESGKITATSNNNNNNNNKMKNKKISLSQKLRSKQQMNKTSTSMSTSSEDRCPISSTNQQQYHSKEDEKDIQLAFFHPNFQWANAPNFNDVINFEKRSPFPIINLLRSQKIRAYANEQKTQKIATANKSKLEEVGSIKLAQQFEEILKLAL
jgi:uncharacterized protein